MQLSSVAVAFNQCSIQKVDVFGVYPDDQDSCDFYPYLYKKIVKSKGKFKKEKTMLRRDTEMEFN